MTFSVDTVTDEATGWRILVLRGGDKGGTLEARVAPAAGGNLFSLKFGGEELLVQPEAIADLVKHRTGTPILFPMPNRVRGGRMVFEGQAFAFEPNNNGNFLHGLARRHPFSIGALRASATTAEADIHLDWDSRNPEFALFPLPHRLTLTFSLHATGLRIAYAVENRGDVRLPFGFGLHPWFRVPGAREQAFLQVPVEQRMEAEEKLPTGRLLPVAGTRADLRTPVALPELDLDDVYIGATPSRSPSYELRDRGLRVHLGASPEFTHVVVYTPPGAPHFCLENQTCSTDAHNLWDRGLRDESHLLVVEKGGTARGFVDWTVERRPAV